MPTPKRLLTIDTSTRGSGWAVWIDGALSVCGRGTPPEYAYQDDFCLVPFNEVVIEVPRHYPASKAKPQVNDLIALAVEAGRLQGTYESIEEARVAVRLITAPEWKGQCPKAVTEARARRELWTKEVMTATSCIEEDCKRDKRKASDVWDAIGIGLFILGRG